MMKRLFFLMALFAAIVCAPTAAHAAALSEVRILTPAYTLTCVPAFHHRRVVLTCVPSRTPKRVARAAFGNWRYGDPMPYAIFAQTPPLGNGGPTLCDGLTITCNTGAATLNAANNTTITGNWTFSGSPVFSTGTPSFSNGFTDSGTTTISGNATFQTGTLSITNGAAMSAAPLTFAAGTYASSSLANVQGDAAGDLVLNSATSQLIKANNKISAGLGIGMGATTLSGLGHEGYNSATSLAAGGATCANNSCDALGTVTLSSANPGVATVTFHTAYSAAPVCVATDQTTAAAVKAVATTTSVVFTGTTSDLIGYRCASNGGA